MSHCHCPDLPQPIAQLQNIILMTECRPPSAEKDRALLHLFQAERALRQVFPVDGCHR